MDKAGNTKELKYPGHVRPRRRPELNDEWLTVDEKSTSFSKAREKIVGRVKGS